MSITNHFWWFRHATVPRFFRESVPHWIAGMLPTRVRYWVLIDAWVKSTPSNAHPDQTTMLAAIKRIEAE